MAERFMNNYHKNFIYRGRTLLINKISNNTLLNQYKIMRNIIICRYSESNQNVILIYFHIKNSDKSNQVIF